MTFRTILGNEHIRSKCGNFKEQLNASFKPQIVNKTLLYGNLHITTHNINNKIKLEKNSKIGSICREQRMKNDDTTHRSKCAATCRVQLMLNLSCDNTVSL